MFKEIKTFFVGIEIIVIASQSTGIFQCCQFMSHLIKSLIKAGVWRSLDCNWVNLRDNTAAIFRYMFYTWCIFSQYYNDGSGSFAQIARAVINGVYSYFINLISAIVFLWAFSSKKTRCLSHLTLHFTISVFIAVLMFNNLKK